MTVVVCDMRSLAADRRHATEGGLLLEPQPKLRVKPGVGAIACCGPSLSEAGDIALLEAVARGEIAPVPADVVALVLLEDGRAFKAQHSGYVPLTRPATIGQGLEVAAGALAMGASAKRAAEVACELLTGCGDGVDVWKLPR